MLKSAEEIDIALNIDLNLDLSAEPRLVFAGTKTFETKVIILATGSMGRTNVVKGESELLGHGVSYCATCDGAFFRDQTVAVIDNNDEALEEALFLTKFAAKIYPIVPTPEGCLSVVNEMQTNVADVFAIGDLLCTQVKQAVIAASDGVIAAVAADKYVHGRKQLRTDWD